MEIWKWPEMKLSNVQLVINNEWNCMEISHTGWEVQGEIMRRVERSPPLPCCFCRVHKKDSEESSSSWGHQSRDCVYLSVFIKGRQYRWLECGWQCICEEFKEINSIWGFKVAGENTPVSRRTCLIISSHTHRGNLWEYVFTSFCQQAPCLLRVCSLQRCFNRFCSWAKWSLQ